MRFLHRFISTPDSSFSGGAFTATIQIRFKKPANTAQTRLEGRTHDPKLDLAAFHHRRFNQILDLHSTVSLKKRGPFVALQTISRWARHVGINSLTAGELVKKYPHIFEVFTHPIRRNICCKFRPKFVELLDLERKVVRGMDDINVIKIKKILSLSVAGRIHIHAIRLMRRELGLPEDFRDSIIRKHQEIFQMNDWEIVELVNWNVNGEDQENSCFSAEVEKWRKKEYVEKWLSELDTKYSFPVNFPTGFKMIPGYKEKLRNWQRLSYDKPYKRMENAWIRTCGGLERYEKRAVGIIHELLCLTVEKMVEVERLSHFRKDFGMMVNLRELLLKHPGIFYIATRGNVQMVFLREAYCKGCLVEPNVVYDARRKLLELMLLGRWNTRELREESEVVIDRECVDEESNDMEDTELPNVC